MPEHNNVFSKTNERAKDERHMGLVESTIYSTLLQVHGGQVSTFLALGTGQKNLDVRNRHERQEGLDLSDRQGPNEDLVCITCCHVTCKKLISFLGTCSKHILKHESQSLNLIWNRQTVLYANIMHAESYVYMHQYCAKNVQFTQRHCYLDCLVAWTIQYYRCRR